MSGAPPANVGPYPGGQLVSAAAATAVPAREPAVTPLAKKISLYNPAVDIPRALPTSSQAFTRGVASPLIATQSLSEYSQKLYGKDTKADQIAEQRQAATKSEIKDQIEAEKNKLKQLTALNTRPEFYQAFYEQDSRFFVLTADEALEQSLQPPQVAEVFNRVLSDVQHPSFLLLCSAFSQDQAGGSRMARGDEPQQPYYQQQIHEPSVTKAIHPHLFTRIRLVNDLENKTPENLCRSIADNDNLELVRLQTRIAALEKALGEKE